MDGKPFPLWGWGVAGLAILISAAIGWFIGHFAMLIIRHFAAEAA